METLSKIVVIVMTVIMVSLFPLQYLLSHHLTHLEDYVENEAIHLVEEMREKEFLDVNMYDSFLKKLSATGLRYDIEIEHAVPRTGADTVSAKDLPGVEVVSGNLQHLPSVEVTSDNLKHLSGLGAASGILQYLYRVDGSSNMLQFEFGTDGKISKTMTGVMTETIAGMTDDNETEDDYPVALSVVPSSYTIYNGQEPAYTVTVTYADGETRVITGGYDITGWSSGPGVKTLIFTYTEKGITASTSVDITVKPNLTGITVNPSLQTVERYQTPTFTVTASFEDGTSSNVLGYSMNGFNKSIIGMQNVTILYTVGEITKSETVVVNVTPMKRTCPVCGTVYDMDENDFDRGCPMCKETVVAIQASPSLVHVNQGEALPITVTAIYQDGHTEAVTDWTSTYNPGETGFQIVMITYKELYTFVDIIVKSANICPVCNTKYSLNADGSDPGCPSCKTELISINASPATQIIRQGEELTLTVYGVYRDGHSELITDWTSSLDSRRPGTQQVAVYHENKSCMIIVTVISENEIQCDTCGVIYNYAENPWGCPVCKDTAIGITAELRSGGMKVAYGNDIDLEVIITYRDNRRLILADGWSDNFNPYQKGNQIVTVSYTDRFHNTVSCNVMVEVVENLKTKVCENGHTYYVEQEYEPCPYCEASTEPTTKDLYSCTFTDEILDKVYTEGVYRFAKGDYITVKIRIRTGGSIYSFWLYKKGKERTPISYGGEVA